MTQSMTGFARCEADTEFGLLAWEARAVNHRHFELSLRLPEECRAIEGRVRERVAERVRRGKVDVGLHLRRSAALTGPIAIDEETLGQIIDAVHKVARASGQAAPPNPVDLLRWPGVVRETERDHGPLQERAMQLLETMLDDLEAGRRREGLHIGASILEKAGQISAIVESVRARLPAVQAAFRARIVARIEDFGVKANADRLEQELAIIAQRLDVAEELERLDGHLAELRAVLDREEPIGRRLDFLLQEFNREANTLGSKSQDGETTRAAVDLKVAIEQIREQVQNLE